jgi:hypothetical protein
MGAKECQVVLFDVKYVQNEKIDTKKNSNQEMTVT